MAAAVLIALVALNAVAAASATRSLIQRRLAVAVALMGLSAAWFVPDHQRLWRGFLALASCMLAMKVVDVARDRSGLSVSTRVFHLFAFYDVRRAPRVAPSFSWGRAVRGLGWVAVAAAALFIASPSGPVIDATVARCLATALAVYAILEVADALGGVLYGRFGIQIVPTQATPISSRSLTAFWGRRWNGLVRRWLDRHVFRPFARRGRAGLGVVAAFTISGLIHAYPIVIVGQWRWAAPMLGFFVVHSMLVLIERPLRVARWPPWIGSMWSLGWFAMTGPLFILPVLHLWDGAGGG